jgi:D-alanyl-D-alanine carboxypeptidase
MDGFKTGYINASGFNLIASAHRGNKRLIGVVFGGRTWKSRNDHMATLLNAGFNKMNDVRYAQQKASGNVVALAAPALQKPMPLPPTKPVFKTMEGVQQTAAHTLQAPATSLASLDTGRKLVIEVQETNTTEKAVASVHTALSRGDYSEITGEGDYDPGTMRRVEAGLLSAAVYKGEDQKVRQLQLASATQAAHAIKNVQPAIPATPVAMPPASSSDLWSIQIGAYTSRVATDDALRSAAKKLPGSLSHARPLVVPLKTSEGILFRARLGNFTKAEAGEACRYFRDCLPVEPR